MLPGALRESMMDRLLLGGMASSSACPPWPIHLIDPFKGRANETRAVVRLPFLSSGRRAYEHPVVLPHVSHFMQVPLRTRVKLPHSPQASPS